MIKKQVILFLVLISIGQLSFKSGRKFNVEIMMPKATLNGKAMSGIGSVFFPEYAGEISSGSQLLEKYTKKVGMVEEAILTISPDSLIYSVRWDQAIICNDCKTIKIATHSVKRITLLSGNVLSKSKKWPPKFVLKTPKGDVLFFLDFNLSPEYLDGYTLDYTKLLDALKEACVHAKIVDKRNDG